MSFFELYRMLIGFICRLLGRQFRSDCNEAGDIKNHFLHTYEHPQESKNGNAGQSNTKRGWKVRKRTVALQDTAASTRVSRTVRRTWYTRIFQCPQVPISYQISCSWTMGQGRLKCLIFFKRNEKTRLLEKKVCVYFSDSFSYVHLHTEMETALAFFDI